MIDSPRLDNSTRTSIRENIRKSIESQIDTAKMKKNQQIYKIPLWELMYQSRSGDDDVVTKKSSSVELKRAVMEQQQVQNADAVIVFAIRQVG